MSGVSRLHPMLTTKHTPTHPPTSKHTTHMHTPTPIPTGQAEPRLQHVTRWLLGTTTHGALLLPPPPPAPTDSGDCD